MYQSIYIYIYIYISLQVVNLQLLAFVQHVPTTFVTLKLQSLGIRQSQYQTKTLWKEKISLIYSLTNYSYSYLRRNSGYGNFCKVMYGHKVRTNSSQFQSLSYSRNEVWTTNMNSPMKYVATLHMPVPKMKSFMRFGMSVKGMQKTHSIRSLTARDSRNRFVTVRMRRFRTRTVMIRLFPMKLRRKMSTYSTIRTVWFMSDEQERKKGVIWQDLTSKLYSELLLRYAKLYKTCLNSFTTFQHKGSVFQCLICANNKVIK